MDEKNIVVVDNKDMDYSYLDSLLEDSAGLKVLDTLSATGISPEACDYLFSKHASNCFQDLDDTQGKLSRCMKMMEKMMDSFGVIPSDEQACKLVGSLLLVCSELNNIFTLRESGLILNRLLCRQSVVDVINTQESYEPTVVKLGSRIASIGDFESQAVLLESLLRITGKDKRNHWAVLCFSETNVCDFFLSINPKDFERDCRYFLNLVNKASKKVFSVIAQSVFLGAVELKKPHGCDLWVDFNLGTQCISFYIMDPFVSEADPALLSVAQWETIVLNLANVQLCYLRSDPLSTKHQQLVVKLHFPYFSVLNYDISQQVDSLMRSDEFVFTFWKFFDISHHLQMIFPGVFQGWENDVTLQGEDLESEAQMSSQAVASSAEHKGLQDQSFQYSQLRPSRKASSASVAYGTKRSRNVVLAEAAEPRSPNADSSGYKSMYGTIIEDEGLTKEVSTNRKPDALPLESPIFATAPAQDSQKGNELLGSEKDSAAPPCTDLPVSDTQVSVPKDSCKSQRRPSRKSSVAVLAYSKESDKSSLSSESSSSDLVLTPFMRYKRKSSSGSENGDVPLQENAHMSLRSSHKLKGRLSASVKKRKKTGVSSPKGCEISVEKEKKGNETMEPVHSKGSAAEMTPLPVNSDSTEATDRGTTSDLHQANMPELVKPDVMKLTPTVSSSDRMHVGRKTSAAVLHYGHAQSKESHVMELTPVATASNHIRVGRKASAAVLAYEPVKVDPVLPSPIFATASLAEKSVEAAVGDSEETVAIDEPAVPSDQLVEVLDEQAFVADDAVAEKGAVAESKYEPSNASFSAESQSTIEKADPRIILISEEENIDQNAVPDEGEDNKEIQANSVQKLQETCEAAASDAASQDIKACETAFLKGVENKSVDENATQTISGPVTKTPTTETKQQAQLSQTSVSKSRSKRFKLFRPETALILSISPGAEQTSPLLSTSALPQKARKTPKDRTNRKPPKKAGTRKRKAPSLDLSEDTLSGEKTADVLDSPSTKEENVPGRGRKGRTKAASRTPIIDLTSESGGHTPNKGKKSDLLSADDTKFFHSESLQNKLRPYGEHIKEIPKARAMASSTAGSFDHGNCAICHSLIVRLHQVLEKHQQKSFISLEGETTKLPTPQEGNQDTLLSKEKEMDEQDLEPSFSQKSKPSRKAAIESQKRTREVLQPNGSHSNKPKDPDTSLEKSEDSENEYITPKQRQTPKSKLSKKLFTDTETTSSEVSWMHPKGLRLFETPTKTYGSAKKESEKKKKGKKSLEVAAPKKRANRTKKAQEDTDWVNNMNLQSVISEASSIEKFNLTIDRKKRESSTTVPTEEEHLQDVNAFVGEIGRPELAGDERDSPLPTSAQNMTAYKSKRTKLLPVAQRALNRTLQRNADDSSLEFMPSEGNVPMSFAENKTARGQGRRKGKHTPEKTKNVSRAVIGAVEPAKKKNKKTQVIESSNGMEAQSPPRFGTQKVQTQDAAVLAAPLAQKPSTARAASPPPCEEFSNRASSVGMELQIDDSDSAISDVTLGKMDHMERFLKDVTVMATGLYDDGPLNEKQDDEMIPSVSSVKGTVSSPFVVSSDSVLNEHKTRFYHKLSHKPIFDRGNDSSSVQSSLRGEKRSRDKYIKNSFGKTISHLLHKYKRQYDEGYSDDMLSNYSLDDSHCVFKEHHLGLPSFFEEAKTLCKKLVCTLQKITYDFSGKLVDHRRELFYAIHELSFQEEIVGPTYEECHRKAVAQKEILNKSLKKVREALDAYVKAEEEVEISLENMKKKTFRQYEKQFREIKKRSFSRQEEKILKKLKVILSKMLSRFDHTGNI